jgi:arginine repressor
MQKFKITNQDELDQFILQHNVNPKKSSLSKQLESIGGIKDWELGLKNGILVFLVCELPDNRITMKNFVVKIAKVNE